jgi:hypothetical protein
MNKFVNNHWIPYLFFCLVAIAGIYVHTTLWSTEHWEVDLERQDIYYSFVEGSRLIEGVNPYERVLSGDMRTNKKYATYFPLFYLLSSCTQLAGLQTYLEWLAFWRVVFLGCLLGISYLIFQICVSKDLPLVGIFGALFWLFNRWTLYVTLISHLDFLPLFLLLLSLSVLPRRFSLACVLFSLSLAVKQIAIFALPLYLIWSWRTQWRNRTRHLFKTFALIAAVPLLTSIPFLIWNAEGYLKSVLFSVTRYPVDYLDVPSVTLSVLLGSYGISSIMPMFFLLGLTYALALFRSVPLYASNLLVMTVFFCFNSVLFRQYTVWFLPFIPLTLVEIPCVGKSSAQEQDSGTIANRHMESSSDRAARDPL